MLHINPEDMLTIIKTTNKFIKIYIDKDTVDNDSITVISQESNSSFSQKTGGDGPGGGGNYSVKFEYQAEVVEAQLKGGEDSDLNVDHKKALFDLKGKKGGILKNTMKSQTQKIKIKVEEESMTVKKMFTSEKDNKLNERVDTEHLPLMTNNNLNRNGSHLKVVGFHLIFLLIFL